MNLSAAGAVRHLLFLSPALLLAACGGAGGPGPSTVSSATPQAPTPTPTVNYDTAEYRRSSAAVEANVLPAWTAGASGAGVVIGIVDSGLADPLGEFTGRIAGQSRDVSGQGRSVTDQSGHGTAVTAVMAAARNDADIVGIAPGATIAMMRADNGDCTDGCRYTDSAIASGLDAAVSAGAKVVNISLGGSNGSTTLRSAFARAAGQGTVIVVSAGNDGNGEADPLALAALSAGSSANVIIVGSVNSSGQISSFSNRAGSAQGNFLLALGEGVRSFDNSGTSYIYSGTSFAAPAVSAAVAILAQAFPNLSAARIVEILLSSADDAGAAGTDSIYGRGLLNIGRAMAPSGQTSLAGTAVPVTATANGTLGPAFGTGLATSSALAAVPVTDRFERSYVVALGQTLRAASAARLSGRLAAASLQSAETATGTETMNLRLQIRATRAADRPAADAFRDSDFTVSNLGFAQRGLDRFAAARNPLRETSLRMAAGGLGLTVANGRLTTEALPGARKAGFVTDDALAFETGTGAQGRTLMMADGRLGPVRLALAASRQRYGLPQTFGLTRSAAQSRLALAAEAREGPWSFALQLSDTQEDGALLGTRLSPSFGLAGGRSQALGGAVGLDRDGLGLRLAASRGRVMPALAAGTLLQPDGALVATSWSASGTAPAGPGRVTLTVARPIAITAGRFRLANGTPVGAAVAAQEVAAELGYDWGGVSLALYQRRNAGNRPGLTDSGAALVWKAGF